MRKRLDVKLESIKAGKYSPADFIIADAKDGDMAMGCVAPGPLRGKEGVFKTKPQYLQAMSDMVASDLVDIMLMSASAAEALKGDGVFKDSAVTPAVRCNDTTDIWFMRNAGYSEHPSRPFSTFDLDDTPHVAELGLYSVTYSNDLERDMESVEAYSAFRKHAAKVGMRHFLEVFNPNPSLDIGMSADELPAFINDSIVRTLAGVTSRQAPLFLKIAYNGPRAMEELASYDPSRLIVGILGGGKGTTRDTFELISQAEKYGARVALFGRKINLAEDPVLLVSLMRRVVQKDVTAKEAVRVYHDGLAKAGVAPATSLADDECVTEDILK